MYCRLVQESSGLVHMGVGGGLKVQLGVQALNFKGMQAAAQCSVDTCEHGARRLEKETTTGMGKDTGQSPTRSAAWEVWIARALFGLVLSGCRSAAQSRSPNRRDGQLLHASRHAGRGCGRDCMC